VTGKLRVIKIRDPAFCLQCSHCWLATVRMRDGTEKLMLMCMRLDCDEWIGVEPEEGQIQE
jgi:hypothetical protein